MACFQGWNCCLGRGDRNRSKVKKGEWRIYSLKELQAATNNFNYDNKLGEGSFGSVYWGQLWDGSQIAVKRLKVWSTKAEMEFSVEVEILGRVRHKNLLNLRGYCADGQERLIVYEYMPNMSLLAHLHGQFSSENLLDWNKRMNIAVGTAEGIAYLHQSATPHIIHSNIKASNVLLDSDFQPKIADFGLTKLIPEGDMHITSKVKALLGYPAPECDTLEKTSESSDVYSYGILLLELVSGRKPIDKVGHEMKCNIIEWAGPLLIDGKVEELIDPKLEGRYDEEELMRVLNVATLCAQSSTEKRPTMSEVVGVLKGINKEDDGATTEDGQVKNDVKSDLPESGKGINHGSD